MNHFKKKGYNFLYKLDTHFENVVSKCVLTNVKI